MMDIRALYSIIETEPLPTSERIENIERINRNFRTLYDAILELISKVEALEGEKE